MRGALAALLLATPAMAQTGPFHGTWARSFIECRNWDSPGWNMTVREGGVDLHDMRCWIRRRMTAGPKLVLGVQCEQDGETFPGEVALQRDGASRLRATFSGEIVGSRVELDYVRCP